MKTLFTLLSLFLPCVSLFSQTDNLFWFAAPDVSSMHGSGTKNGLPANLYIVAESLTTVTISQPANIAFTPVILSMAEGEAIKIQLDNLLSIDQIENYPDTIQNKAFRITADPGKISVSYDLDNTYNKGSFSLKGRNAMGKDFFVSTQNFFPNATFTGTAWSGFVIAATENNTRIVVWPSDDWYNLDINPGDSLVIFLQAGETYAFRAASIDANRHINGARVKSNKDIVITSYDDSMTKKYTDNATCTTGLSFDIIGDQWIPLNRIGKEYIVLKGELTKISETTCPAGGGEKIFVTSTEPNTDLMVNGTEFYQMAEAGQVLGIPVDSFITHVQASNPVYVMHITGFRGETGSAVLPPADKSIGSGQQFIFRSAAPELFRLNLAARNKKDIFQVRSIDAFSIFSMGGWNSIPAAYFEYSSDSSWIALKNTPEALDYINSKVLPGYVTAIRNPVTNFQLGVISGETSTGCKYGYMSDYTPKSVPPQSKDSLQVVISSRIFENESVDEWLVLKITDTISNRIWYDTSAVVSKAFGFHDTVYVDSGVYKCEIIDMGANVEMPVIKVDNHIIPWGYPENLYYLFTIPGVYPTKNTIWLSPCDSMVSPSGKYTWRTGGTWYDTIPNAEGFDSLLTVNLNVKYSTSAELTDTACFSYVSPSGILLENSGTYHEVITNSAGCDSSITIYLTVNHVDNTVETIANTLKAVEEDATYQWLACASGLDITGAAEQMYTPVVTGLYAVRITKNGCTITSSCNPVTAADQPDVIEASYYPNPVGDELNIDLKDVYSNIELRIDDMSGRSVLVKKYAQENSLQVDTKNLITGIYFVRLVAGNRSLSFKIVK